MKTKVIEKAIVLYGEEQGEITSFSTLWEAYKEFKEIKREDKHYNIKDTYYWQFEYIKDGVCYARPIKFYVRKNKMYWKYVK